MNTIYQITQIPADSFERFLKEGKRLDSPKGKRLKGLLGLTKPLDDLTYPLKFDSEAGGFKPDTWDMGEEANAVLPRAEPEVVAEA